jgi:hypothetical protein
MTLKLFSNLSLKKYEKILIIFECIIYKHESELSKNINCANLIGDVIDYFGRWL